MDRRLAEVCHPEGKRLLGIMAKKKSNLCVALDVTTKREFLALLPLVAPHICILKTHMDIINDFDQELVAELVRCSAIHDFMILEDRKFADIGHTAMRQYTGGVFQIREWAQMVTAHVLPGEGLVKGLKQAGKSRNRTVILMAKMSSGQMNAEYEARSVELALKHSDFVIGLMGTKRYHRQFLTFTPGVSLEHHGDELGQHYETPVEVISRGADVIIIGRSIIESSNPGQSAAMYRQTGWDAYSAYLNK